MGEERASSPTVFRAEYTSSRRRSESDRGCVRGTHLRNSVQDTEKLASQMIGSSLITKQTGAGGRVCNAVSGAKNA